jgi:hypothetical protein
MTSLFDNGLQSVCENREKAPALKRMVVVGLFPGALKRSFPRINAGAPTKNPAVFQFSHTLFSPLAIWSLPRNKLVISTGAQRSGEMSSFSFLFEGLHRAVAQQLLGALDEASISSYR